MVSAERAETLKKALMIGGLVALFFGSFLLFLFVTFPYEVLKESIAAELSQATGYTIRIGGMSANIPLGMTAEDVRVEAPTGGPAMTLKTLSADVSVLQFLIGKVATDVELEAGNGSIELDIDFSIFDLIAQNVMPSHFGFEARAFPLDEAAAFGLGAATNAPGANPMVAPLLSAIGVSGELNGNADFKLDSKAPTQSTGHAEITINKAVLKLDHPSLGLPNQVFQKALLKAKVEGGDVVLDKNSGFVAEELEVTPNGKVKLAANPLASQLDLKVLVRLNKGLKERFGFIIDAVTGNPSSDGQVTMQVRGPMENPSTTTF